MSFVLTTVLRGTYQSGAAADDLDARQQEGEKLQPWLAAEAVAVLQQPCCPLVRLDSVRCSQAPVIQVYETSVKTRNGMTRGGTSPKWGWFRPPFSRGTLIQWLLLRPPTNTSFILYSLSPSETFAYCSR